VLKRLTCREFLVGSVTQRYAALQSIVFVNAHLRSARVSSRRLFTCAPYWFVHLQLANGHLSKVRTRKNANSKLPVIIALIPLDFGREPSVHVFTDADGSQNIAN